MDKVSEVEFPISLKYSSFWNCKYFKIYENVQYVGKLLIMYISDVKMKFNWIIFLEFVATDELKRHLLYLSVNTIW